MAGIGFELRKFLAKNNFTGIISAYGYAGIVASGPWLLAVLTILVLSLFANYHNINHLETHQFRVIVVYLIAGSLIFSSIFQHSYTRYLADECYLHREEQIIPSLNSIYLCLLLLGGILGGFLIHFMLPNEDPVLKLLMISCFVVLSLIWVTTSALSGLFAYKTIFFAFLSNFIVAIAVGFFIYPLGIRGLMISFLCGQFVLFMILVYIIYKTYPAEQLLNFDFYNLKLTKKALILTGLFYNIGIWIDKFIFWYSPSTGTQVIGHLYESIVYDTPIFLAYLAVIPGMTLFLLHMETEYEDAHESLYNKINGKNTLTEIRQAFKRLLLAGRIALYSVIKSESYVLAIAVTAGTALFIWFSISTLYFPLFCILLLAATLTVLFWAALDIMFYLNKLDHAVWLTFIFMVTNAVFTWVSIQLGVYYFGYGLVASLLLTDVLSFILINHEIANLQYETYMLQ